MYRILVSTEFSKLNSGYAVYGRELLRRLHSIQGIEVAELAQACQAGKDNTSDIPWKVYPVIPPHGTEAFNHFNSNPYFSFGAGIFDSVVLDFKPTHVLGFQDIWMMEYQLRSPFRKFYSHIIMPAVDNSAQHKSWIDMYSTADKVLGYTQWGLDVLSKSGLKNIFKPATPVANETYKELKREEKESFRKNLGFGDVKIIGTVMRNQPRKLFPELFRDFRELLNRTGWTNTYLLCHTSSPDTFLLDELLIENEIGNRVLFTYYCSNCGNTDIGFYRGEFTICQKCLARKSSLPNVRDSVNVETLNLIYNLMDLYVQYATNEGFGIPLLEAVTCGVPICAVDTSAMCEILQMAQGRAIKVKSYFRQPETGRLMAIPDQESFISNITEFFSKDESGRKQEGQLSKLLYGMRNWDDVVKVWVDAIASTAPQLPWNHPPIRYNIPNAYPQGLGDKEFAQFLICDVLQEPERIGTFFESRLIRDISNGMALRGTDGKYYFEDIPGGRQCFVDFNRDVAFNHFRGLLNIKVEAEQGRIQML